MSSVLVIVPTRDRPKELAKLIHSVLGTSQNADIHVYVDNDQQELYGFLSGAPRRVTTTVGARIGPVAVANLLHGSTVRNGTGRYDAVGFVPDDARFTIAGWDKVVLDHCVGKVAAVAPEHGNHEIDMPFLSRRWLDATGWFAWPGLYHWGWPSATAALAIASDTLVRTREDEFYIDHPGEGSMNRDKYPADIINLYSFFASGAFEKSLAKLRETK